VRRAGALAAAALACGCAGPAGEMPVRQFDLGYTAPAATLPPLRAVAVKAAMPYDGVEMHYRLAYRDGAELAAFAHSRWAAPPAEMVRRQFVRALPANSGAPCALELELVEFSQVFTAPDASEARIELRAAAGGAARSFRIVEPGAGPGAAAGAGAFARGVERALAQVAQWIGSLAACRSS
jgi:cholesterol transport system auxiliary component